MVHRCPSHPCLCPSSNWNVTSSMPPTSCAARWASELIRLEMEADRAEADAQRSEREPILNGLANADFRLDAELDGTSV